MKFIYGDDAVVDRKASTVLKQLFILVFPPVLYLYPSYNFGKTKDRLYRHAA